LGPGEFKPSEIEGFKEYLNIPGFWNKKVLGGENIKESGFGKGSYLRTLPAFTCSMFLIKGNQIDWTSTDYTLISGDRVQNRRMSHLFFNILVL